MTDRKYLEGRTDWQVIRPGVHGLRRHIIIEPEHDVVAAEVEDDFHHFRIELYHDRGRIDRVEAIPKRHPWTLCAEAGTFLAKRLEGTKLAEAPSFDSMLSHCTHQFDLALLAASRALDREPTLFSMLVEDLSTSPRVAQLRRNGKTVLTWRLDGDMIISPSSEQGLHLRRLREWLPRLAPKRQEAAALLRRAVFISDGRRPDLVRMSTAAHMSHRMGACYVYQSERADRAQRTNSGKDFSSGEEVPLGERARSLMKENF